LQKSGGRSFLHERMLEFTSKIIVIFLPGHFFADPAAGIHHMKQPWFSNESNLRRDFGGNIFSVHLPILLSQNR
jgi:hypothetical protein